MQRKAHYFEFCTLYRTVFAESVHGVMNMKDEDGFEPTSESTHLSLPTRYELANGFTSTPSRLLGDLEEKHLPQTFSIATRVAHDGIRIAVTSVRIALSNLKVQHLKDLLESRRSCRILVVLVHRVAYNPYLPRSRPSGTTVPY